MIWPQFLFKKRKKGNSLCVVSTTTKGRKLSLVIPFPETYRFGSWRWSGPCEVLMVLSDVSHYFPARPSHTNKDAPIPVVEQPPRGWITCHAEEAAATNKSVKDAMISQSEKSQPDITSSHWEEVVEKGVWGGGGRSITPSSLYFIVLLAFIFTCLLVAMPFPCILCAVVI